MKIIITGATGYIGGGVLQRALKVDEITEITVLSRRELDVKHPKLKTILKKDYTSYTQDELTQLKGFQGCIWALGSAGSSFDIKMGYPRAALKAFTEHLAPALPEKTPFRFILTSGEAIIADQKRWVLPGLSKLQELGQLEVQWAEHEREHAGIWQSFIVRPAMVHDPSSFGVKLLPAKLKIELPVLSAAMVDIMVHGSKHQTNGNAILNEIGKKVLASDKTAQ